MSYFTGFVASLCAACIFIGAVHLICPDGPLEKSVKYILSLAFLATVISVIGFSAPKISAEFDFQNEFSPDTVSLDKAAAEYVYGAALASAGIEFSKINVCTDKIDSGSIIISKVIIYSNSNEWEIRKALGAAAEMKEVEIIND